MNDNSLASLLIENKKQYLNIEENLINNGGEITEEIDSQYKELTKVENLKAQKVDNINFIFGAFKSEKKAIAEKIKFFQSIKKGLDNSESRLKDYVRYNMLESGLDELTGIDTRIKLVGCQTRLVIDLDQLPKKYLHEKITLEPNKDQIKKDLESGIEVPGASIEGGTTIKEYKNRKAIK